LIDRGFGVLGFWGFGEYDCRNHVNKEEEEEEGRRRSAK